MDEDLIKVIRPQEYFGNSVSEISDVYDQTKSANLRRQRIYDIIFKDSEDNNLNDTNEDILNDETVSTEDTDVEFLDITENNPNRSKPRNIVIPQGKKYKLRSKTFKNRPRNQSTHPFHLKSKQTTFDKIKIQEIFNCDMCSEFFPKSGKLKKHIQDVHGGHKCKFCGKLFYHLGSFRRHIRAVHEDHKYNCESCGKLFSEGGRLKKHIHIVHEGHRDYSCESCGRLFSTTKNLKRHKDSVHEKRKFQCDICPKFLSRHDKLMEHKKIHEKSLEKLPELANPHVIHILAPKEWKIAQSI